MSEYKFTPVETDAAAQEAVWRDVVDYLKRGDGAAAKEHLAAGRPIYITEDDTPQGLLIKQYPSGRRELVRFNRTGDEVIRVL